MDADTKNVLFNVIDTYIQNFKTKKAFAKQQKPESLLAFTFLYVRYGTSQRHRASTLLNLNMLAPARASRPMS